MKNLKFAFALVLFVTFMQSCEKEPIIDTPLTEAPSLPLEESFVMPFDGFEDNDTTKSFSNWVYAATNVVVWNIVLTINLAVPVASFHESFKHTPEYQGDNTWLWSYGFNAEGQHYTANLYGKTINPDEVEWRMLISQAGGFTDVEWYSGVTAIDNSYATWTINFNPYNPSTFIGIEYQANDGDGASTIRYTNQIPNVQENGGYIEYREALDPSMQFNRSYDVYKIEINNLLDIDWNYINNEGRVKDPQKFQDNEWHCWDNRLMDVQC